MAPTNGNLINKFPKFFDIQIVEKFLGIKLDQKFFHQQRKIYVD